MSSTGSPDVPGAAAPVPGRGLPLASQQDGTHPRPQMLRAAWADLDGTWAFRHDDDGSATWSGGLPDPGRIVVPFPPESAASGVQEPGFHPVVWYSRAISPADLRDAGLGPASPRLLLHFGAVDFEASVWIDGQLLGRHEGGSTPFTLDATAALTADPDAEHLLVVRAADDPHDTTQPRGKQDWHEEPHAIWYRRTSGIWQTVWLEAVPEVRIEHLTWTTQAQAAVQLRVQLRGAVPVGARVRVALRSSQRDEHLGAAEVVVAPAGAGGAGGAVDPAVELVVPLPRQANGQAIDELAWTPEDPHLVDATVGLVDASGAVLDAVSSYLGLRTVGVGRGAFLLNGRPYDVRSVLNQGYWPQSHLAAPSRAALRREVELIKELGFNAARNHQKVEDPRFLHWADRLGLLVWAEMPSAYTFGPRTVQRLVTEWMAVVERDASHPCVVTWVPINESWGVGRIASDPAQQALARALADVTRALDPTRPVISNDGWEHTSSDIISVHDYDGDGASVAARYADDPARTRLLAGMGPAGRRILVDGAADDGQPVMLTEFGGVDFQPGAARDDGWGYTRASDGDDWLTRLTGLYDAVRASSFLAGSCYTQLTDTLQETNGLLDADRVPKAPAHLIRRAVTGERGRGEG